MRPLGVLTSSYPAGPDDGAGSFVRGFAVACARAGLPVEVLCPEPATPTDWRGDPGVRVDRLAYWRPRSSQFLSASPGAPEALAAEPWRWAQAAAFSARLTAQVVRRRRRYRALISHWLLPSALAGALGGTSPQLAIAHGSDVHLLERLPAGRPIARLLVGRGLCFAFVSTDLRDRFAALLPRGGRPDFRRRAVVQPMGVDGASLVGADRGAARARLGLRGPAVLWLGRLVPVKRPSLALELAAVLPDITLLVAGAGPLEPSLRAGAKALGDRVRLLGWVNARQRRELLAAADVLLITSTVLGNGRSEGTPVAALEALAAGLPVIGTRVGGLAELDALDAPIRLVDDGDVAGLAQAITDTLSAGRPSDADRERIAYALDWHSALPRLLEPLGLLPKTVSGVSG